MLRKILASALDADVFAISNTRPSEEFLSKCHVVAQTDEDESQTIGTVKDRQSKPSAKVVAVVDRTANITEAASICGMSRVSFNGRSVYAPDIVLVNEFVADDFLLHLIQPATSPLFKKSNPTSQHVSKLLPDDHTKHMKELEGDVRFRVIVSGASGSVVEVMDR